MKVKLGTAVGIAQKKTGSAEPFPSCPIVGAIRWDTHSRVDPQSRPAEHQKISFKASWMFRGELAAFTCPKVLSVTVVSSPLGIPLGASKDG